MIIHAGGGGFQPTYEELKRRYHDMDTLPEDSFQPTYEELKPSPATSRPLSPGMFSAYL